MVLYQSIFIIVGGEEGKFSIITASRNQGGIDRGKESY